MSYYDSDLADRAVKALYRWYMRNGELWQQPSRYCTRTVREKGRWVVEVRNGVGLLAKYAELPSGRLQRLVD